MVHSLLVNGSKRRPTLSKLNGSSDQAGFYRVTYDRIEKLLECVRQSIHFLAQHLVSYYSLSIPAHQEVFH